LGSGWIRIGSHHKLNPCTKQITILKTINFNIPGALLRRSWSHRYQNHIISLITREYNFIDWHSDFKSGYEWNSQTWYHDIKYGKVLGVDIKSPWELSRLQHLPQIALLYLLEANEHSCSKYDTSLRLQQEFENQVLDFISSNPPRFGVNWSCTMDVGIRIANILLAYDLLAEAGAVFSAEFLSILTNSVYDHGLHIVNNLEWSRSLRGNHYLANIAGLLFVAVHLPSSDHSDTWLAFAIQELNTEILSQFNDEGTNFEASTCYHRLSAEMAIYCVSLVLGLDKKRLDALSCYTSSNWRITPKLNPAPLPLYPILCYDGKNKLTRKLPIHPQVFHRLEKAAEFTHVITKQSGKVPQVGDNDSGRFFILSPILERYPTNINEDLDESRIGALFGSRESSYFIDSIDHTHLLSSINGIFHRDDFNAASKNHVVESKIVASLAGEIQIRSYREITPDHQNKVVENQCSSLDILEIKELLRHDTKFHFVGSSLRDGLQTHAYPQFGLFVFKSDRIFLSIRAGSYGQNGFGGHAHNDQLSIELQVDKQDIILDPGTGCYTPYPKTRNAYRSVHAHFTPSLDSLEPALLNKGLFRLITPNHSRCCILQDNSGLFKSQVGSLTIYRQIKISDSRIVISDFYPKGHSISLNNKPVAFSPGYGIIIA
jgi:hypothetical protein